MEQEWRLCVALWGLGFTASAWRSHEHPWSSKTEAKLSHKSRSLVPLSIYTLLSIPIHLHSFLLSISSFHLSWSSLCCPISHSLLSCMICRSCKGITLSQFCHIFCCPERGGTLSGDEFLHLFCHGQRWADDRQALVRPCHVAVCLKSPSSIQLEPPAPFCAEESLDSLYWFIQLEKDIHKMDTPWEFWKKLVYSILLCRMK